MTQWLGNRKYGLKPGFVTRWVIFLSLPLKKVRDSDRDVRKYGRCMISGFYYLNIVFTALATCYNIPFS